MDLKLLDAAKDSRVLFMGEEITDVYHYGRLLARPVKEPIVAIQKEGWEEYEGGITAAAKHAESFCKLVGVASDRNIKKERFVSSGHYRKLFEVYAETVTWDEQPIVPDAFDITAVIDYGHGMMTDALIAKVCNEAQFLAVNVQTNAGNYGFNLATKYPRADYLCMDELEARLATQNQDGLIADSIGELADMFSGSKIIITLGKDGAIGWDDESGLCQCNAFTDRVVDTMGAGDAFFAVTAVLAPFLSLPDLLRIGNAAGALKAQILGHQRAITKDELSEYLRNHS